MSAAPPDAAADTISLDDLPCRHVALLREITARLERIGGQAATLALHELADSTLAHIETVEATIALIEAMEAVATAH